VADGTNPTALDVLDVLGFCTVARRSPTLDGQIALRAAQGCQPLLEGNALGLQVVLPAPLTLHSTWLATRPQGPVLPPDLLATLRAHGQLSPEWAATLSGGVVQVTQTRQKRFRVWTGLLVRPRSGVVLWVTPPRNREHPGVLQLESTVEATDGWTPLVVDLQLPGKEQDVTLQGELATIIALAHGTTVQHAQLKEMPDAGRAHLAFYDPAYFAEKHGHVTTKYRRLVARTNGIAPSPQGGLTVVEAGPLELDITPLPVVHGPHGVGKKASSAVQLALFRNPVSMRARFDGHAVAVNLHQPALNRGARAVTQVWEDVLGKVALEGSPGAMLYLTRFINLHPPSEPYFFVKPWALGVTPPGWSTVVEGVSGKGYRILRGVVRTDRFHALPAVIQMLEPGQEVQLAASIPLLRAVAIPRTLQEPAFDLQRVTLAS
jgi:hypothetical protein